MIPILYSKSETQFLSNGLGRLTECISCDVTEERNGIYECEFQYPVTGRFCKEMMENGGVISVTHDNHGDRQAFDIYKFSAPIDGIVTFNAHHISYRLNGIIVTPFEASTCAGALQKISQKSANTNPFTFTTDKSVTAPYILNVPANARGLLAGNSGSILDIYGTGEYEFDMFTVNLHLHRGQNSGATIRYGKNLTDIVNILDKSEIYNAIAPYWTDGEQTVTLPEVYMAVAGATDIICVPVDLTADFEEKPSVSDLRDDANRYLSNINPTLAHSNITIDFEALWQTTEYEDVAVLQQIGLCDTVSIYFPAIGVTQASAKAIKTVYDSLRDKYKSIEFGDPQTTLAESILGKDAKNLGDLGDGKIIGASIITAALIKAAKGEYNEINITDDMYGISDIYFSDSQGGTWGDITRKGFWFQRGEYKETIGGQQYTLTEQRTLEGKTDHLGIKFSPEKDGTGSGMATIAGFETVKDHFSSGWVSYEEAYGRLILSRVKCDPDNDYAPVQVDKVVVDTGNGAKIELYGSEINADVLTSLLPRKWQQFFSGSSVAVEIGNSGTKSYLILKNSSGTACVTLDTSTGAAFAIPVTATAGLSVSGGLTTDTFTSSGDASVGGNLSVTGSVTASGGVSVSGGLTTDTSSVSGNASVGGDMTITGDVSADDVTVGGTLGVTGATTLSGNATVGGDMNITGDVSADDVTVDGVLDVVPRRCYASIPSAGWYRVLTFDADSDNWANGYSGVEIDVSVGTTGSYNERHDVSLFVVNGNVKFVNETSVSRAKNISKIRYTRLNNYGHIDIRFDSADTANANIAFYTSPPKQHQVVTEDFTAVANSPSGETVMTEYTFAANTDGDYTFPNAFGKDWYFRKRNGVVYIDAPDSITPTTSGNNYIGALPDAFKPKYTVRLAADNSVGEAKWLYIDTTGGVYATCYTTPNTATGFSITGSYLT